MQNCYDALEAIEYLNNNEVDLIFLDLNMPKLKGFEFLRTLSSPPKVIVTTAYKEFAIEGYELNIVDYLLKPFSFERFLKAVNKAISLTDKSKSTSKEISNKSTPESVFLRSNKKHIQVAIDHILYIEASGNYSKVITSDDTIIVREKISDLILSLPVDDIIQVHKSFAVSKRHISSIEANRIFIGSETIPIGSIYKRNVALLLKSNN
jgi:DNA-binding LytR/AlgR family response regulator